MEVYYTQRSQSGRLCLSHRVTREASGSDQMARDRIEERAQAIAFIGISVEKARWSKMNNLGLTRLNNFSWLFPCRCDPKLPGPWLWDDEGREIVPPGLLGAR